MKSAMFPTSAATAAAWAKRFGEPEEQAIRRWIKFAALDCLARDESLNSEMILRGSLALSFYDPLNRLGPDIDIYSLSLKKNASDQETAEFVERINKPLHTWLSSHFPDLANWSARIRAEIKIEIMRLEYQVQWHSLRLPEPSNRTIRVACLECLIAEKLLAMLNQAYQVEQGRHSKSRSNDVLDIHRALCNTNRQVDLVQILLQFKGRQAIQNRRLILDPLRFDQTIQPLVAKEYSGKTHDRASPVPFEKAWSSVITLVRALTTLEHERGKNS